VYVKPQRQTPFFSNKNGTSTNLQSHSNRRNVLDPSFAQLFIHDEERAHAMEVVCLLGPGQVEGEIADVGSLTDIGNMSKTLLVACQLRLYAGVTLAGDPPIP